MHIHMCISKKYMCICSCLYIDLHSYLYVCLHSYLHVYFHVHLHLHLCSHLGVYLCTPMPMSMSFYYVLIRPDLTLRASPLQTA